MFYSRYSVSFAYKIEHIALDFSCQIRQKHPKLTNFHHLCYSLTNNTLNYSPAGLIDYRDARNIYQQFCPNWSLTSNPRQAKCGGGVEEVVLNCAAGRSVLRGGVDLPFPPTVTDEDVTFPKKNRGFVGRQRIDMSGNSRDCIQEFTTGIYCLLDRSPCIVMAAWDPTCADRPVKMCGMTD